MIPLHGIACFYDVGFGARAVSRKTPIYFMLYKVMLYKVGSTDWMSCGESVDRKGQFVRKAKTRRRDSIKSFKIIFYRIS